MPDEPALQAAFGQPGGQAPGCGFPVATMLTLCDAAGFIARTIASPLRTHEASQLVALHEDLDSGDVLVYDRAGCSYAHLALVFQRNLHAIFRMHQRQIVSFRPGRKHARGLGKGRRGVPTSQWLKLDHPEFDEQAFFPHRSPRSLRLRRGNCPSRFVPGVRRIFRSQWGRHRRRRWNYRYLSLK